MPSESDLAPVSLVRAASRWVSGNSKPLRKRPKSIAPPGMGLRLTQVSAAGLRGLRQKEGQKMEPEALYAEGVAGFFFFFLGLYHQTSHSGSWDLHR